MKIIFVIFVSLLLTACSYTTPTTPTISSEVKTFTPEPTYYSSGVLEYSQTGNISLDLSGNYRYLDSEKKTFFSGTLASLLGEHPYTIVYFYPKDGTPNCTIQALDFSLMKEEFAKLGYGIIGISKDNIESHLHFAERNELRIKLLSDNSGALLRAFGNEGPLAEYGNGSDLSEVIRSTFIVDSTGKATYAFRDIDAKGHARRIYELISGHEYLQ